MTNKFNIIIAAILSVTLFIVIVINIITRIVITPLSTLCALSVVGQIQKGTVAGVASLENLLFPIFTISTFLKILTIP